MVELIEKIILNKEDISKLDELVDYRKKKVIIIFISKVKKMDSNKYNTLELVKNFILEFERGSIVSRYINGENIDINTLDSGIDLIIYKIIENTNIEKTNHKK